MEPVELTSAPPEVVRDHAPEQTQSVTFRLFVTVVKDKCYGNSGPWACEWSVATPPRLASLRITPLKVSDELG